MANSLIGGLILFLCVHLDLMAGERADWPRDLCVWGGTLLFAVRSSCQWVNERRLLGACWALAKWPDRMTTLCPDSCISLWPSVKYPLLFLPLCKRNFDSGFKLRFVQLLLKLSLLSSGNDHWTCGSCAAILSTQEHYYSKKTWKLKLTFKHIFHWNKGYPDALLKHVLIGLFV